MRPKLLQGHSHISCILQREGTKGSLSIGSVICLLKADIISTNQISAILTCSGQTFQPGPRSQMIASSLKSLGIHHKYIRASDTENYQINSHFEECVQFIKEHRTAGRNVLVHCHAGKSRSASIVIAYLIDELGMSLQQAFKLTKQKRPIVQPNMGFLNQLKAYQRMVRQPRRSIAMKQHHPHSLLYGSEVIERSYPRQSLPIQGHQLVLGELNSNSLAQSMIENRPQRLHPETARELGKYAKKCQEKGDFKKQRRIQEMDDKEVDNIKAKVRQYLQQRKKK